MWILVKHPSTSDGSGNTHYLLAGRKYIAGRKDCDILIPGDISISRRHATLQVSSVNPADPELPIEGITITDTSKVGVLINAKKITANEATSLKDGDFISFGRMHMKYKLTHKRLAVVTSCINSSSSKATVKSCVQKLGGYPLQSWSDKATHLVMEKVTFTIKVVCAIACEKHVVSVKYLEDLLDCCDKKTSQSLPQEKEYLPPISEKSLVNHELLFQPNSSRSSLMVGKLFIILVPEQFKRIKDTVQYAGGEAVLKDTKDRKLVNNLSSTQTIVMQVEKKDEKSASKEQISWINEVYAKLAQHNLRAIRESEVGLAILHASLDTYCNPTLNAAPPVIGSTHTQVMMDSMYTTQQTQQTQQTQLPQDNVDETQAIENMPSSDINHSVSIVSKEKTSKTAPGDTRSPVKGKTTNSVNSAPKRKRPIPSEDGSKGQSNLEHFFKKPKVKYDEGPKNDEEDILELLTSTSTMDVDKPKEGRDVLKGLRKNIVKESPARNSLNVMKESPARKSPNAAKESSAGKSLNVVKPETSGKKNIISMDDDDIDDDPGSPVTKTQNVDKPEKSGSNNIINIDDDEEEDVFSFDFSKPTMSMKTYDDDNFETMAGTNKVDETTVIAETLPRKSTSTTQATAQIIPESDAFTSSKNRVPDSCLSSLLSPLSRKVIPETCLPNVVTPLTKKSVSDTSSEKTSASESCPSFLQKGRGKKSVSGANVSSLDANRKLYDYNDDEDDDPFSFSVDISAPVLRSTAKDTESVILASKKNVNKERKKNDKESVPLLSKNINKKSESKNKTSVTDKLVSDSDTSFNKSVTDDERQQSRFLKAISSSQDSLSENVYVSDEDGKLVSARNKPDEKKSVNVSEEKADSRKDLVERSNEENDVDMSRLLDDEDVISKEYSLQNERNHVALNGFISTLDMQPRSSIIKEEDRSVFGAGTNLVQTSFVSLVVKQPKVKNVPRKTSDVPGSKLKNFKSFKKQYFAGRSKKMKAIGTYDLVVYESGNQERADLFAGIREQDEKEAAENRRIDKMFEVMTRKR